MNSVALNLMTTSQTQMSAIKNSSFLQIYLLHKLTSRTHKHIIIKIKHPKMKLNTWNVAEDLPSSTISGESTKIINWSRSRTRQHPKIYPPLQPSKIAESPILRRRSLQNGVRAGRSRWQRIRQRRWHDPAASPNNPRW